MTGPSENFENIVGGAFGQMEAHLGPEAYQVNLDTTRSIGEYNRQQVVSMQENDKQQAIMAEAAAKLQHNKALFWLGLSLTLRSLMLIAFLVAMPVVVMLWRSAV